MKNIIHLIVALLLFGIQSFAQNVAINNDGSEPDPSAVLDVKATDKGVLIPRVDFSNLPLSPPTGLLVYVTSNGPDGNNAFYYFDGTQWEKLSGAVGLENFIESNFTYDSKTGVKFTPDNAANNVDFVLQPKGAGGILSQQPDGTAFGGNKRGDYAIDFQCVRANASEVASGIGAIILGGANNTSSGYGSVVLGGGLNVASGDASAALGYAASASGHFSYASGYESSATGEYSLAMGNNAAASGVYAVAIGNHPAATSYASLAMGDYTSASGRISTAMGNRTTAPSAYETVLGRYNSDYTPASTTDWIATDRLFVVGNGATDVTKSNAFTILKNANTTIGGSLTLNGNGTNASITFPIGRGSNGQVLTSNGSGGISWATPAVSQWTTSGSNIYYNAGNIGIGTTNPRAPLEFANTVSNRKIVFYTTADNDHQFTGFGLNGDALRFQLGNLTGNFKFYGATSATTSNELFRIQGNGQIMIPAMTTAGVLLNSSTGLVSSSVGSNGQVLSTNGSGGIEWTTPANGTVTGVSGSAPIMSSGGTSPVISINPATTSSAGSMSAADKTKLDGLVSSHWTSSGSNIFYNSGNIGVGTSNPGSRLTLGNNVGDGFDAWTDYQLLLFSAPLPQNSFGIGIKASTLAFNSDSDFDFDQDGSTVMTIQSGNVGIGTPDPTQKLEVSGNVFIPAGSSYWIGNAGDAGNRLRLHQTGSNAYIDWGEETLFFRSGVGAATNKVVFTGDGKVGIGTTTPRAGLDLGLGISNRKLILYTTADNDHQFTGLGVNVDAMRYQISNTSANHKFYAATSSTASTELFRIQGNGQIVIPALTTSGVLINSASGVISSSVGTSGQVLTTNASGGMGWTTNISSQWTTSGTDIYYNGNVGIGTTTPSALLDLGNATANRKIVLYTTNNNDNQYYGFGINYPNILRYQVSKTASSHVFYAGASETTSTELFRIQGDGKTGVGTSTPANKIDIEGNAAIGASYSGAVAAPADGMIVEGPVGIGSASPDASAKVEISSTTQGFLPPRMTSAQRNAIAMPAIGLVIFNTTLSCLEFYTGNNWVSVSNDDVVENSWTQKADFGGTARTSAVGFSIGTKGYIGTGKAGTNTKDFWEYNTVTNSWTQKADFGGAARLFAVGFSIGTKGYIGTGESGVAISTLHKDFWEYDPGTNTWTQKADFGGLARSGAVGFSIGTKGYIGTGYIGGGNTKDFWEFNPATNSWTQKADFGGTARRYAVGFSIGIKGYIGTGYSGTFQKDFWEYDPGTNTWNQKADLGGLPRALATGFSIGTKGYIGTGGTFDPAYYKDFWEYIPDVNTWTQKADFQGSARFEAVGFSIGIKGYIGTGDSGTDLKDFWEYVPE